MPSNGVPSSLSSVAGWALNNVVNVTPAIQNYFQPKVITPAPLGGRATYAEYTTGFYKFQMQTLAPSDKDMRALDDYFEAYGYNVQIFGKVNLKVRDTFTYIKTRDAQVTSPNLAAANQMAAMLNAGCKFWVTEIGAVT